MSNQQAIQTAVGWLAVLVFFIIAYQSMSPELDISPYVIAGLVVVIAMLLGKLDTLAEMVESWSKR